MLAAIFRNEPCRIPARFVCFGVCHGGRAEPRPAATGSKRIRSADRDGEIDRAARCRRGFVSANVARVERLPGRPARLATVARMARPRGVERPGCGRRAGLAGRADSADEARESARKGRVDSKQGVYATDGRGVAHDVCQAAQRGAQGWP